MSAPKLSTCQHGAAQVFNLFNMVIERLADGVRPFAEGILRLLPAVWHGAEGQSLLRIQACSAVHTPSCTVHTAAACAIARTCVAHCSIGQLLLEYVIACT